jgi:hypothetical protein
LGAQRVSDYSQGRQEGEGFQQGEAVNSGRDDHFDDFTEMHVSWCELL